MKRVDAHCHVNFDSYGVDREEVISRALEDGTGMVIIGTKLSTSKSAVELAEKHSHVWATVGLHPSHLFHSYYDAGESTDSGTMEVFDPATYRELAESSDKVVAIGEFGLDYYRIPDGETHESTRARQLEVFRAHCDLALELGLPVMIHCRDAHDDCAGILEEYASAGKKLRGNIHCFTGTTAEAQRYVKLGFHVSFTGIVTYKPKKGEEPLIDVAAVVPLENILIETDAPYLAPAPHRGTRNEPAYVSHIAQAIADRRGVDVTEVEQVTLANTKELFGI